MRGARMLAKITGATGKKRRKPLAPSRLPAPRKAAGVDLASDEDLDGSDGSGSDDAGADDGARDDKDDDKDSDWEAAKDGGGGSGSQSETPSGSDSDSDFKSDPSAAASKKRKRRASGSAKTPGKGKGKKAASGPASTKAGAASVAAALSKAAAAPRVPRSSPSAHHQDNPAESDGPGAPPAAAAAAAAPARARADCPVCGCSFPLAALNDHLDTCLAASERRFAGAGAGPGPSTAASAPGKRRPGGRGSAGAPAGKRRAGGESDHDEDGAAAEGTGRDVPEKPVKGTRKIAGERPALGAEGEKADNQRTIAQVTRPTPLAAVARAQQNGLHATPAPHRPLQLASVATSAGGASGGGLGSLRLAVLPQAPGAQRSSWAALVPPAPPSLAPLTWGADLSVGRAGGAMSVGQPSGATGVQGSEVAGAAGSGDFPAAARDGSPSPTGRPADSGGRSAKSDPDDDERAAARVAPAAGGAEAARLSAEQAHRTKRAESPFEDSPPRDPARSGAGGGGRASSPAAAFGRRDGLQEGIAWSSPALARLPLLPSPAKPPTAVPRSGSRRLPFSSTPPELGVGGAGAGSGGGEGTAKPSAPVLLSVAEDDPEADAVPTPAVALALGELFGSFETAVVGRRFHRDVSAAQDSRAVLVREPLNAADPNAILVVPWQGPSGQPLAPEAAAGSAGAAGGAGAAQAPSKRRKIAAAAGAAAASSSPASASASAVAGGALGHIPAVVAREIAGVIDQGLLECEAVLIEGTEDPGAGTAVKILVTGRAARGLGAEAAASAAVAWANACEAAGNGAAAGGGASAQAANLIMLVQTVLDRDKHLFLPSELDLLRRLPALSAPAAGLLVRLLLRVGTRWLRIASFDYREVPDPKEAAEELAAAAFASVWPPAPPAALSEEPATAGEAVGSAGKRSEGKRRAAADTEAAADTRERIEVLTVPLLKELASTSNVSSAQAANGLGRAALLRLFDGALAPAAPTRGGGGKGGAAGGSRAATRQALDDGLFQIAGALTRLDHSASALLRRAFFLYFLNPAQDLSQFLLVDIGVLKYPRYQVPERQQPIFTSRADLLAYEAALSVAESVQSALEAKDYQAAEEAAAPAVAAVLSGASVGSSEAGAAAAEAGSGGAQRHSTVKAERPAEVKAEAEAETGANSAAVTEGAADAAIATDVGDGVSTAFARQFAPSTIWAGVSTVAVSLLERRRDYSAAVALLQRLLSGTACPGRRGEWWVRLAVDLDHLRRKEDSLDAAEAALTDPWVRTGDRILLLRRVVRLSKPPRRWKAPQVPKGLLAEPRQRMMKGVLLTYESSVKSIFLRELIPLCKDRVEGKSRDGAGAAVGAPTTNARNGKGGGGEREGAVEVIELDFDDSGDEEQQQAGGAAAAAPAAAAVAEAEGAAEGREQAEQAEERAHETCSVEQLALDQYAQEGWTGTHCEGGAWLTLFGLVMFDILFDSDSAPTGAFRTPFQTAPLDLGTAYFLPARRERIEARLREVAAGAAPALITATWALRRGSMMAGVSWTRQSLAELQTIAACVNGPRLAAVFALFCEDYSGWRGGMPDLLLWRVSPFPDAMLVEVKGPRDALSGSQRAWVGALQAAGLAVEVCKVQEAVEHPLNYRHHHSSSGGAGGSGGGTKRAASR